MDPLILAIQQRSARRYSRAQLHEELAIARSVGPDEWLKTLEDERVQRSLRKNFAPEV